MRQKSNQPHVMKETICQIQDQLAIAGEWEKPSVSQSSSRKSIRSPIKGQRIELKLVIMKDQTPKHQGS